MFIKQFNMLTIIILASVSCLAAIIALIINKWKGNRCGAIQFAISLIAIICSFVALAVVAPRDVDKSIEMDYLGLIIGILSVLITILIGWQLYSVFKIKDDVSEAAKAREEANNATKEAQSKVLEVDEKIKSLDSVIQEAKDATESAVKKADEALKEAENVNSKAQEVLKTIDVDTARVIRAKLSAKLASETAEAAKEEAKQTLSKISELVKRDDEDDTDMLLFLAITDLYTKDASTKEEKLKALKVFMDNLSKWEKVVGEIKRQKQIK